MSKRIISYANKLVYVGIDVHKESYSVVCVCEGKIVKTATMPADRANLTHSLLRWFTGARIKSVYEAGYFGFALHRELIKSGIDNIVINPASLEVAANDRVKTDKRDAKKMAFALAEKGASAKGLTAIYIPTIDEELARQLPRTRAQIVRQRSRISAQIKSKLHQFGLMPLGSTRVISNRYIKELEESAFPEALKTALNFLFEQWRLLTRQLMEIRQLLQKQAKLRPKFEQIYKSVPGIGPVSAAVLATELGDMSRFANERRLFSYTGLTPGEYSSGEHTRRGSISRQGPSQLRALLTEAAWRAIRKDKDLRAIFERIALTRGKKRAIVAIARRLIGRIRACFRIGTLYIEGNYA